jgi:hypothetical protein
VERQSLWKKGSRCGKAIALPPVPRPCARVSAQCPRSPARQLCACAPIPWPAALSRPPGDGALPCAAAGAPASTSCTTTRGCCSACAAGLRTRDACTHCTQRNAPSPCRLGPRIRMSRRPGSAAASSGAVGRACHLTAQRVQQLFEFAEICDSTIFMCRWPPHVVHFLIALRIVTRNFVP